MNVTLLLTRKRLGVRNLNTVSLFHLETIFENYKLLSEKTGGIYPKNYCYDDILRTLYLIKKEIKKRGN